MINKFFAAVVLLLLMGLKKYQKIFSEMFVLRMY
jgi:hypothetical protein